MIARPLSLVLALVLLLPACGGDEKADAIQALSDSMVSSDAGIPIDRKQADCLAEGIVGGIGVDQLREYGVLAEKEKDVKTLDEVALSPTDAEVTAASMNSCLGFRAQLLDDLTSEFEQLSPRAERCFARTFSDQVVEQILVAELTGKSVDKAMATYEPQIEACVRAG